MIQAFQGRDTPPSLREIEAFRQAQQAPRAAAPGAPGVAPAVDEAEEVVVREAIVRPVTWEAWPDAARRIFQAMGMSYDDLGKTEYLPFGESVELIKNRQLDATLQSAGLGVASIKDLSVSLPITMVSVPESVAETLGAPFLAATIPAGTYEGQSADVPTLAITNVLVTHSDVSEETAYQMTKQLFENLDEMVAAHAAAKAISAEKGAMGLPIPLHPGAERYYKEKGLL